MLKFIRNSSLPVLCLTLITLISGAALTFPTLAEERGNSNFKLPTRAPKTIKKKTTARLLEAPLHPPQFDTFKYVPPGVAARFKPSLLEIIASDLSHPALLQFENMQVQAAQSLTTGQRFFILLHPRFARTPLPAKDDQAQQVDVYTMLTPNLIYLVDERLLDASKSAFGDTPGYAHFPSVGGNPSPWGYISFNEFVPYQGQTFLLANGQILELDDLGTMKAQPASPELLKTHKDALTRLSWLQTQAYTDTALPVRDLWIAEIKALAQSWLPGNDLDEDGLSSDGQDPDCGRLLH